MSAPVPHTRADDDDHRSLLSGDPGEFACEVADFRAPIDVAFKLVCAHDPLEQPLSSSVRLYAADVRSMVAAVAVNDVRKHEPESETLAQASRDRDCLNGTGGLVNCAHDGSHHRSLRTSGSTEHRPRRATPPSVVAPIFWTDYRPDSERRISHAP
jgi:hypothetical protein